MWSSIQLIVIKKGTGMLRNAEPIKPNIAAAKLLNFQLGEPSAFTKELGSQVALCRTPARDDVSESLLKDWQLLQTWIRMSRTKPLVRHKNAKMIVASLHQHSSLHQLFMLWHMIQLQEICNTYDPHGDICRA